MKMSRFAIISAGTMTAQVPDEGRRSQIF